MFEHVFSPPIAPSPLRRTALPAAIALQTAMGMLLVAHALFGPERLAPPITLTFWAAPPALEPPPARRTEASASSSAARAPTRPRGMEAPNEIPARPPDTSAPNDTGPGHTGDGGVPGGADKDPDDGPGRDPLPVQNPPSILETWQVHLPKPVYQPSPEFPRAAAAMHLEGRVVLQLVVDETGAVREAKVVQSTNPIFDAAAVEAVRRWKYTRPIDARSGAAVACYLTVVVNFRSR